MSNRSFNLEYKCRLGDVEPIVDALRTLGAVDGGILVQRDTYFRVGSGRMKLREMPGHAELITYDRDETGPDMLSRYSLTLVDHPANVREELAAQYGIRGVIEKSRRLWLYKNARIHLDHVGGLGSFLEIEVVEPRTQEEGQSHLHELTRALLLERDAAIQQSYIDLLEASSWRTSDNEAS